VEYPDSRHQGQERSGIKIVGGVSMAYFKKIDLEDFPRSLLDSYGGMGCDGCGLVFDIFNTPYGIKYVYLVYSDKAHFDAGRVHHVYCEDCFMRFRR